MSENLKLWNAVEKTDPKYTKSFSRAGGFSGTAINATYLIRKATEQWGPIGGLWGADVEDEKYAEGGDGTVIHVLRIRFKHPTGSFPAYGQTTFVGKNKNGVFTDEEAPKKSMTDAITKALSMLGFSSDVHLGLYDDNKYVNDRKAEFGAAKPLSVAGQHWEEMGDEEKKFLQGIADQVRESIQKDGGLVAMKFLEEQNLQTEEKVAIWSRFDSKERAAMEPHKRPKKAA